MKSRQGKLQKFVADSVAGLKLANTLVVLLVFKKDYIRCGVEGKVKMGC